METVIALQLVVNILLVIWLSLIDREIRRIEETIFDLTLFSYIIGKDKLKEVKNETSKKKE